MVEGQAPPAKLFVQLGVLDPQKLQSCLEMQEAFEKQGLSMDLGEVVLQMGLATLEQVSRVRAHNGTAALRCPKCRRRFTVPEFQANRRYKCEPCLAYLEIIPDDSSGFALTDREGPPQPTTPSPGSAVPPRASPAKPAGPKKDMFEGRVFGAYRLIKRVAKGGMGAVYLGEEMEKGGQVAVKILTGEFSRMPGIQGRFKREAGAALRLDHPNIVRTIEMGKEDTYVYIVSEYLSGGSLVDLVVKEKRLTPQRAVEIIGDVLAGLQHAHEAGVVHRDIKPGNVLLTPEGRAKVIDFGLAKDAESNTILTLTGNVVGTPAYMAPEQAMGETAGPASDQYACGILTWLMLTGRKPFDGKNLVETLKKQIEEPLPSAREINPDVPEELEKVLKKMTAKQPAKRYDSPATATYALRKAVDLPVDEPPKVEADRKLWIWITIGAIAAAAAGAAAALMLLP